MTEYENLIAGPFPLQKDTVTIGGNQNLKAGCVLGFKSVSAGAKGKRVAWPNARIMIHQPLIHGEIVAPASDIQIQADQIQRVKTAYKSVSLIVWDLFSFELHRQLFAEIAHNADLTVIPMKYAQTSKLSIYRILQFLKSFHVRNIVGFLYKVNNKHYNKVTL